MYCVCVVKHWGVGCPPTSPRPGSPGRRRPGPTCRPGSNPGVASSYLPNVPPRKWPPRVPVSSPRSCSLTSGGSPSWANSTRRAPWVFSTTWNPSRGRAGPRLNRGEREGSFLGSPSLSHGARRARNRQRGRRPTRPYSSMVVPGSNPTSLGHRRDRGGDRSRAGPPLLAGEPEFVVPDHPLSQLAGGIIARTIGNDPFVQLVVRVRRADRDSNRTGGRPVQLHPGIGKRDRRRVGAGRGVDLRDERRIALRSRRHPGLGLVGGGPPLAPRSAELTILREILTQGNRIRWLQGSIRPRSTERSVSISNSDVRESMSQGITTRTPVFPSVADSRVTDISIAIRDRRRYIGVRPRTVGPDVRQKIRDPDRGCEINRRISLLCRALRTTRREPSTIIGQLPVSAIPRLSAGSVRSKMWRAFRSPSLGRVGTPKLQDLPGADDGDPVDTDLRTREGERTGIVGGLRSSLHVVRANDELDATPLPRLE